MGPEAPALDGVEGLFQERAEDRRVDVPPIVAGGAAQLADLLAAERQHPALLEEGAVEAPDVALDGVGVAARVHRRPELFDHRDEARGIGLATLQRGLEGGRRKQADVGGEHREETAHQEHGDVVRRVARSLQRLGDGGEPLRDGAGHARRVTRGVEGGRVLPDRPQAGPDLGLAELVEVDAEAAPVGELVIDLPVAPEVRVDLETVADIADDEEGRRLVVHGQQRHVGFRLLAGVDHQDVPGPVGTAAPLARRRHDRQGELPDDLVAGALQSRLLGFQDEATPLVEVDPGMADEAVAVALAQRALEDVVVARGPGLGGIRSRQAEHVAEFDQEEPVVGAFLAALPALPAPDEGVERVYT